MLEDAASLGPEDPMASIEKHVTRELAALDASAPCTEAARLMAERRIGSVAVTRGGSVVGLVTERDLVVRIMARSAPMTVTLADAMRTDVPTVGPETTVESCAALMRDHVTRHLLVRERGEVTGVISMRDVIRVMLDDKEWLIDQLHTFIDGSDRPRRAQP
jgi:CBS domain-containing protein